MPQVDDIRIGRWNLLASAGTTQRLIFTVSEPITTLSVQIGGTVADVDDLTGADAYAATIDGLDATVDIDVPTRNDLTGTNTPLRLVVDGAVVTVGQLTPSSDGSSSPDNTITVAPAAAAYTLTLGGIVVVSGGEGGGAVDSVNGQTGVVVLDADDVGAQPVDSDLTAIAALTTTAFGRGLLALADAAAGRTALGVYSSAETDAVASAAAAALVDSAPGTLDTLNELAAALGDDPNFATTITTALAGKQPLDSDLTAIAALTTTAYGRSLLEAADAAALRTLAGVYSTGEVDTAISNATSDLAPLASPTFTGTVSGVTKSMVGLGNVDNTSDANKPVSTAQQTALDAKANVAQAVNAQTGTTYTLVAADAGKLVTLSNAGAITLTVPQDSDATIAVGTYVDLMQLGAGQVTVAAGTGATLRVSGLTAKARAQYARLGVQKVSTNTWSLFGDLAAS